MALDDASVLQAKTSLTGAEYVGLVDSDGLEKGLKVNGVLGLLAGDVTTITGTTGTISTRMTVSTNTSAVALTLPPASGPLRQIFVLKIGTNNATLTPAGSDVIVSTTVADATLVVATTKAVQLLSDGTKWYHVSNDA